MPVVTGEDTAIIFLDTDKNIETGEKVNNKIGADYMIKIKGRYGFTLSEYYKYNLEKNWEIVKGVKPKTACDEKQLEAQIGIEKIKMGDGMYVYFHIIDWQNNEDYSEQSISNIVYKKGYNEIYGKTKGGNGDDYPYSGSGDWVINSNTTVWNETIILNGSLYIENNGKLIFRNVTLKMNCASDGQYNIHVNNTGTFYIWDYDNDTATTYDCSVINSTNTNYEFEFFVKSDSTFEMKNCELHECGWSITNPGLLIETDKTVIESTTLSNNYCGISFKNSDYNNIINCNALDNYRYGIDLYRSDYNNITNCNTSSNSRGIIIGYSVYNNITDCNTSSNSDCGIYLVNSDYNHITNCNTSNDNNGILFGNSDYNHITDCNTSSNDDEGIYLSNSDYNNIINCTANYNKNIGITLDQFNDDGSDYNNLTDCNASLNGEIGIFLTDYCNHNIITNCNAYSNTNYGIYLISYSDGSDYNNITNCNTSSNEYGIYITSSDYNNITYCNAYSNDEEGITIYDSDYNNIIGCNASDNDVFGILLSSSENNNIISCNVSYNNYDGIRLWSDCDYNNIINCKVTSNAYSGLQLLNSDYNKITGCNASDNDDLGIYLSKSNHTTVNLSNISNNDYGIYLTNSNDFVIGNSTIKNSDNYDFYLTSISAGTTINTTFDYENVYCSSGSNLTVKNYLKIKIIDIDGDPIEDAEVQVKDNTQEIYASSGYEGDDPKTDENGLTPWIYVTDGIFNGSSTITENKTYVNVSYDDKDFGDLPKDVNMSTTHTETIQEIPEFSTTFIPLLATIALFILFKRNEKFLTKQNKRRKKRWRTKQMHE